MNLFSWEIIEEKNYRADNYTLKMFAKIHLRYFLKYAKYFLNYIKYFTTGMCHKYSRLPNDY